MASLRRSGSLRGWRSLTSTSSSKEPATGCSHRRTTWTLTLSSARAGRCRRSPGTWDMTARRSGPTCPASALPGNGHRPRAPLIRSGRSWTTCASAWLMTRTCGRWCCSTRRSGWGSTGPTRRSPRACAGIGSGRTASRVRPRPAATTRCSSTRRVRRCSGTGSSCPTRRPGGTPGRTRTCWSGRCRPRAGGVACWLRPSSTRIWSRACTRSPAGSADCRRSGGSTGWRRSPARTPAGSPPRSLRSRSTTRCRWRCVRRGTATARAWWRRRTTARRSAGGAPWATT